MTSANHRPPPRRAAGAGRLQVAGAAGGVGTSTLAAALRGLDRGVSQGGPVDVLVCSTASDCLEAAAGKADLIGQAHRPPVLAVTVLARGSVGRATTARLRLIAPHVRAVVVVPHVTRWQRRGGAIADLQAALTPGRSRPRHLKDYLGAVAAIGRAVGAPVWTLRGSTAAPAMTRRTPPTLGSSR